MIGIRSLVGIFFFGLFKQPKKVWLITNQLGFVPFLLLYFPHLRLGEWLWRADRLNYTFKEMWDYVSTDPLGSLVSLVPSIMHALTGWLVLLPLHWLVGYALFAIWFRFMKNSKKPRT